MPLSLAPGTESRRVRSEPAPAGDSGNIVDFALVTIRENDHTAARFRGLRATVYSNLGFRCAPPQALCWRRLRRLVRFLQRTLETPHHVSCLQTGTLRRKAPSLPAVQPISPANTRH